MDAYRRHLLFQSAALGLISALPSQAQAPRHSRILVPFAPDGISSHLALALSKALGPLRGEVWTTEHIPGHSNMDAARDLLKAAAQAHWDLMIAGPTIFTVGESLNPFMSIKPERDLKVLTGLLMGPMVVISHVDSGLNHWEKIKQGKRRLRVGVSGLGSPAHYVAAHLDKVVLSSGLGDGYNTEGDAPSMQRLARGELDLAVVSIGSCLPPQDEKYHALLTSGAQPLVWKNKQSIPTIASIGPTSESQTFQFDNWLSACVSARMPLPLQQELIRDIESIKRKDGLRTIAQTTRHETMFLDPLQLLEDIVKSKNFLDEYILRADLTNSLGLEL